MTTLQWKTVFLQFPAQSIGPRESVSFNIVGTFWNFFQSSFVTGAELKSTLEQLESLEEIVQFSSWPDIRKKLEVVLKRLESYEVGKYTDWRNKVSDILDQNLGKHLIRREDASDREEGEEEQSKVGRFVVNFTSDLSDTFAEVIAF